MGVENDEEFFVKPPEGRGTEVELPQRGTDAYGVSVQSVGLDEGGDIRAIRGPLGIPIGVIYVLPWLLLLLAIGLAAFWLWRRWRGGADDGPRRSVIIPRLPHEEAYEALDRLEASSLLEQMEIKQYHISVSEIIRSYVEGRFDIFALELTTCEVMEGLHESGLDDDELAAFDTFLSRCDLVKFAKLRPTPHACRQVLATARELVDRTRPRVADFASGTMRNGDDGPMQGGDEDDVQDEDGTQDENGGGSPSDCDDPTRPGEPLLESAGVEEA